MTASAELHSVEVWIGKTVLSRSTANKLGQIHDLVVDPVKGELSGLSLQTIDGRLSLIDYAEVYSFGPDAVMVNSDESAIPAPDSLLKRAPLARNNLIGAKVISEGGKVLGQVANVYVHLSETPPIVYEVRSSILDKLLGHSLFFPASFGCAFSEDATRLVVSDEAVNGADHTLDALATRLFGPPREDPLVIVRSRGH